MPRRHAHRELEVHEPNSSSPLVITSLRVHEVNGTLFHRSWTRDHDFTSSMERSIRHVSPIGKKLVKEQYLPRMSSQYGELWPTSGWDRFCCLGHPCKFQQVSRLDFVTAATSLNRSQHDIWPSPGLVHYIFIFGSSYPVTEFARCKIHFASKSCTLLYWQCYCVALE